ncbi:NlpC/P60 family protein [Clostridium sp.]|uniref:C40 family peptidase n=1 Tax=Clostridium sp. TaxID=1506 RepID=UPI003F39CA95
MRKKKLIGITILGAMAVSMSLQATTIGSLTNGIEIKISEGEIITKEKGEVVEVIDKLDNAYATLLEKDLEHTLNEEMIKIEGALTTTLVESTNLRKEANENAEIITTLSEDVMVFVEKRVDNWYLVKVEGKSGYIYKSQINEEALDLIPYTQTIEEKPVVENEKGEEVVEYAKQFLGNPYVYGGNSLTRGVDCSGFTSQIYKNFGIQLQRSSRGQYASNGYKVSKSEIKPGDLVFYGNNGVINHVAIYAGNGQIIHANDAKTGIKMSKLEYGKPMIGIKRLIKS